MRKFPLLSCTMVFFVLMSCSSPTSSSEAASSESVLPDITTKIVGGKTIPDAILGFKIGMTSDEIHQVAAKRGMRKNTVSSTSSKHIFNCSPFLGLETERVKIEPKTGIYGEDSITITLKKSDRATFDQATRELANHLGAPVEHSELGPVTETQWTYGLQHLFYIRLNLSYKLLHIVYTKS